MSNDGEQRTGVSCPPPHMTVHSLERQRKKHDDGRCHEPGCNGVYRVLCPYRGQHPERCSHERRTPPREYLWHGFLQQTAPPKCKDCGQNIYE